MPISSKVQPSSSIGVDSPRAAFWTLFLISAPLAEILSGNVPILQFFNPIRFIILSLLYGLPVVIIRELAIIYELNLMGILLLGLGYGIFNEGIAAKTLTLQSGPPVNDFVGYGQLGPFQGSWAVLITLWHALHSVLYPILITHWLWPKTAKNRWTSQTSLKVMILGFAGLCALHFAPSPQKRPPIPFMFVIYLVVIITLLIIATQLCRISTLPPPQSVTHQPKIRSAYWGMLTLFFYLMHFILAKLRLVPFPIYLALSLSIISLSIYKITKAGWRPLPDLLEFALGDYLSFSQFSGAIFIAAHKAPLQHLISSLIFLIIFTYLIRAVEMNPAGRSSPIPSISPSKRP